MKIIFVILFSLTIISSFVFANGQSEITIEAHLDKKSYTIADEIIVTGKIIGFDSKIHSESPVTMSIISEKRNVLVIDQVYPNSDGTFSFSHKVFGDVYSKQLVIIAFERNPAFQTEFTILGYLKIIEVESNPPGSDIGKEWVRLFNPLNKPIDLTNMIINSVHGDNNRHKLSGSIGPCDDLIVTLPGQFVDNEFDTLSITLGTPYNVHSVDVSDEGNDDSTWKLDPPECEGGQNQDSSETQIDPPSLELDADVVCPKGKIVVDGKCASPPITMPTDEPIQKIPDWVKNIFVWYGQDQVSEDELLNAIKYLINEKIIKLD